MDGNLHLVKLTKDASVLNLLLQNRFADCDILIKSDSFSRMAFYCPGFVGLS